MKIVTGKVAIHNIFRRFLSNRSHNEAYIPNNCCRYTFFYKSTECYH